MQPFPIPFEPTNLVPCLTARSRREVNTFDATNTRLVEHWQTDSPSLQNARRDLSGVSWWMDMNPTPSRLYREDLRQSQPYSLPSGSSPVVKKTTDLNNKISQSLQTLQTAKSQEQIANARTSYNTLLQEQSQLQVDTLAQNPYFTKYDVATDSRNVIRELRGVVSEDVVDRGLRESQTLLSREIKSRWLPPQYAQERGLDQLSAFELMRPKFNKQNIYYR
jgi:type II secretory pathway pseudopilin PulG